MPNRQFLTQNEIKVMFEPITSEMRGRRRLVSGRSSSRPAVKKFVDFSRSFCMLNFLLKCHHK